MSFTSDFPIEIARQRVLETREACAFVSISDAEWRRMRVLGETPPAVKIGSRKLGYTLGSLIDWIAARTEQRTAA
jgi:predicted DNA-binding transcriptional regulator AlpA